MSDENVDTKVPCTLTNNTLQQNTSWLFLSKTSTCYEQTWGISAWHCKQLICIWLWQFIFGEALPASIHCLACYSFREQLHLHIGIIVNSNQISAGESSVKYSMHGNSWGCLWCTCCCKQKRNTPECVVTACCHQLSMAHEMIAGGVYSVPWSADMHCHPTI